MLKRYIALASALCLVTLFIPKCPFTTTGKSAGKSQLAQTPAMVAPVAVQSGTSQL